ncbi:PadR family transcriptional regulator [Paenibacillus sp. FSL L8-0470]|uniref:PadR family transcriptional regulator n=1 Tax=unclassified Paenibacillus TaxID=185978 RepID=UPI0030F6578A
MAKSGNTMFAVLGVLTKGVYSGYDIKKHFSGSLHHFWSESYGQIYPALKQLVAQGYAVEASTPNQTRGQKKYQITPEGMEHFREWLSAPIGALNYRDELLLKVFFATPQDREVIRDLFEHELGELTNAMEVYREQQSALITQKQSPEDLPMWMLTLNYGILSTEARLQWCKESIEWLNQQR